MCLKLLPTSASVGITLPALVSPLVGDPENKDTFCQLLCYEHTVTQPIILCIIGGQGSKLIAANAA
jgi:hypothetical protein